MMTVISPEVAELLERMRVESQALVKQSWSEYEDLVRRVGGWARKTIEGRIASARLVYTVEKCTLIDDNPIAYCNVPFPPFHEWLVKKEYELLRMSTIRQLFPANIEQEQLMDIMEAARNNASMHYLPPLVLVEDDAGDFVIVCRGD